MFGVLPSLKYNPNQATCFVHADELGGCHGPNGRPKSTPYEYRSPLLPEAFPDSGRVVIFDNAAMLDNDVVPNIPPSRFLAIQLDDGDNDNDDFDDNDINDDNAGNEDD